MQALLLTREVRKELNNDRRTLCEKVGIEIQSKLDKGDIREAFNTMKGWYKDLGERPPLPSRDEIETTRREYEDLYKKVTPSGDEIEFDMTLFNINDSAPEEEEVVRCLYWIQIIGRQVHRGSK